MTVLSDAPARETTASPGPSGPSHRATVFAVGAVLVAGLVFFFWTRSDLWLDEALSVDIARVPFGHLQQALRHDGAPPLYYALLHVWTALLGTGDRAVRSLSGIFMAGAAVALWFVGRRVAGRAGAWTAVLVIAANPFAIRYATETRMYALEIFLVSWGILAFRRALESPRPVRLVTFGAIVACLLYTQYWALYLLLVVAVVLVGLAWHGEHRDAARWMLLAMIVAGLSFMPWVPTFLFQRAHTGTPWGTPQLPGVPFGYTLRDFAGGDEQEGWLLLVPLVGLFLLGLFGRATDRRRIELDLHTEPGARWEAIVGGATLATALTLNYLAGGAFQSRYSAVVFPFFVVVVARGITTLADPRVRAGVVAVVVTLGFTGATRNVFTDRTQAGQVAAVLRADAVPGDVVVYCPDQLGPAVHRLIPSDLDQVTYPAFGSAAFVDWVDYTARLARTDPAAFAHEALARAGDHTLWFVTSPGYITHPVVCQTLSTLFAASRARVVRLGPDERLFEHPGLQQFPAGTPASG
ncbi:MAG TPA: glycosyltransferase family 39 protein [Acidimicrobiia bacterium]|nr:glycosyltransferase family 39 protein [Acidimicrobiia bacterium]